MIRQIAIAAALLLSVPAGAHLQGRAEAPSADDIARRESVGRAVAALRAGRHDAAVAAIDPVIAGYEKRHAGEKRMIFCATTVAQTILYMTLGAAAKRDAVALEPGWCDALFLKGFILADAKRYGEAQPWIERAVAMAPNHAHYLNELGYVLQQQRQWQPSLDAYQRAVTAADLSDERDGAAEKGRAWRGMGFALIEQGKWDEAKAVFENCLKLDPADAKARGEIKYIEENRPKVS